MQYITKHVLVEYNVSKGIPPALQIALSFRSDLQVS